MKSVRRAFLTSGDTKSQPSLEILKLWLQKCIAGHKNCGGGKSRSLPTRLLSINRDKEQFKVQLIETRGLQGRYISLSHCWGYPVSAKLEAVKSTLANYESHMHSGILWNALPHTFQDAIVVAHQLGVEYIWIDSLCIVQDSPEDWAFEASQMATIYANSLLTIAASAGLNSNAGLFSSLPLCFQSKKISGEILGHAAFVRQRLPHNGFLKDSLEHPIDELSPLLRRGWCYQERILSTRVVHFAETELSWECSSASWCECQSPDALSVHSSTLNQSMSPKLIASIKGKFDPEWWNQSVCHYSRLALTFSKDKLPAFAGVAKVFGTRGHKDFKGYAAGLWESQLPHCLLWRRVSGQLEPQPSPWRAPSWSWAAVEGRISSWFDHRYGPPTGIKVLSTVCKSAGPDEFGEVTSASMVISARIIPSIIRYIAKGSLHLVQFSLLDKANEDISETNQDNFEPDYDIFRPGPDYVLAGATVFIVQTFSELSESRNNEIFGPHLVLIRTPALNTYERIGIVRIPVSRRESLFSSIQEPTTFTFV
jgi:hypothetical protein